MGQRYNDALLAVERTGHGNTVLHVLLEKNYPNIYYHVDYDVFKKVNVSEPGWKTSVRTKPMMIDDMAAAIRAGDIMIWSENFFAEASALSMEGQKLYCPPGCHDDEVDALMIALQVREQTPIIGSSKSGVHTVTRYAPSL